MQYIITIGIDNHKCKSIWMGNNKFVKLKNNGKNLLFIMMKHKALKKLELNVLLKHLKE